MEEKKVAISGYISREASKVIDDFQFEKNIKFKDEALEIILLKFKELIKRENKTK